MAGNIFISYRRDDDPGFALALYQRLKQEFSGKSLFMDVEGHIKAGDDFAAVLSEQVAQCDVLLAIIGERWIGAKDADGNRRLEKDDDFVRIEIASALGLGKRVIPVLVNKAEMPRAGDLPPSLKPLAHRNAVAIRPTRFEADCQGLINALKEALALAEAERAAKSQAEREAAEAERKRREAEEEARVAQLEAAARERALAGLTPEEIRKAEELANWDFIKESARPDEFRDHLARFSGGPTDRYARKKLESLLWADPATQASIDALRTFIGEFPAGDHAAEAKVALEAREGEAEAARQARERAVEAARQAKEHKRAETEAMARVLAPERLAVVWVYGHSNFFYWWVVWAYGFICAFLTGFEGHAVGAPTADGLYFYPGSWLGASFIAVLFFMAFFTNYRLKGRVSFATAIVVLVLSATIISYLDVWDRLLIYMNFAFYISLSTVLLALWLFATFVLDKLVFWEFTFGQVTRRHVFGEGSESYDAYRLHIDRVDDDILINKVLGLRFLGLGTADLTFTMGVFRDERFTIPNVWRATLRAEQILEAVIIRPPTLQL